MQECVGRGGGGVVGHTEGVGGPYVAPGLHAEHPSLLMVHLAQYSLL